MTHQRNSPDCPRPPFGGALGVALLAGTMAIANPGIAGDEDFFDLELKEVLELEITTVSKKPQTVSQAAAAVFVLTTEDIRRSPATTIPDLLRSVPGIQVSSIGSSVWAVSARGMDGRFTNKLLVLIDGRSAYSPTFSGVYWDVQDTVLEDIERIEVIRGPGATLWGANAVNGVINIITKSAAATQGTQVNALAGREEKVLVSARHGGALGSVGHWRAYAKTRRNDATRLADSMIGGDDDWHQSRVGFRIDLSAGDDDAVTMQGDYYRGRSGENTIVNALSPPYASLVATEQELSGGNLLARWQRTLGDSESFTLQAYFDHGRRDWPAHLDEHRNIYDTDLQFRSERFAGHDLVAGIGYRYSQDSVAPALTGIRADALQYGDLDASSGHRMLSVFVQDDITLLPDRLVLTVGTKIERHDGDDEDLQPNLRLLYTPSERTTVWASAARAVRTASRVDRGGRVNQTVLAPASAQNPLPLPVVIQASGDVGSEHLTAYEAGLKQRFGQRISAELAVFYNRYRDLRAGRFVAPVCQPSGAPVPECLLLSADTTHVLQRAEMGNGARASSRGFELSADWRAHRKLALRAGYSFLSLSIEEPGDLFATDREGTSPRHQGFLQASWSAARKTDVDALVRHVGRLDAPAPGVEVPSYTELDLRLAWRPRRDLELAVAGRNLLHASHAEFVSELGDMPALEVERSVFGQLRLSF
ncbi:MAG: TonB-dependent receptor [Rhodocyclaceae bacterium]|nr:TonB-dependent receptor [Rhodocyclaceae bacterium]